MNSLMLPFLLIFLTGIQAMAQSGNAAEKSLEERLQALQWQKRVLLLLTPDTKDAQYRQQKNWLTARPADLKERDLVLIELGANEVDAVTKEFLRKELKASADKFQLLLIGKDGGVKYRTSTAAPAEEIFSTIDAMPMRQREMKQGSKPE